MTETLRRWHVFPRTIRALAIAFAAMSALITLLFAFATASVVHREIERQIDSRIVTESDALLDYEHDHGFDALVALVKLRSARDTPAAVGYLSGVDDRQNRAIGYIVTDGAGHRVAGLLQARIPPPGWSEFVRITRPDGSHGDAQALNSKLQNGGRLIVAGDREMIHRTEALLRRLLAVAVTLMLLLGGAMVFAFGKIVSRRIDSVERSAASIVSGDLSQRLPLDGTGVELDRLSQLVNRLLDHIAQLLENQRAVSEGVAHDLRTPLSRVRAKLEQMLALATETRQREMLESAIADSDILLALFGGILAIAEVDSRAVRNRFKESDLGEAVAEIAEAYRPALEDQGMHLAIEVARVAVSGDRLLLQRLVANALDNVLAHAGSASRVDVGVHQDGEDAVLRIADNGPGIPAAQRERVFERLVRLAPSRSTPGHGLGLNMVRAIVAAHDGEVRIGEAGDGFALEVRIPSI